MRVLAVVWMIFGISACGPIPERTVFPSAVDPGSLRAASEISPALWIAGSDYFSTGKLFRFDLKTGQLSQAIRAVGTDVHLVSDGKDGLFMLSRNGSDSITRLKGAAALPGETLSLPDMMNPQSVVRDREGRVWFVSMDSNSVLVYSSDLQTELANIDLSSLAEGKDSGEQFAELSDILLIDSKTIAVVAARLDRQDWLPQADSGYALISTESFQVIEKKLIPVSNAVQIFSVDQVTGRHLIVGSGSQLPTTPNLPNSDFRGSLSLFGISPSAQIESFAKDSRLIHAAMLMDGTVATIEWNPERKTSCLRRLHKDLVCYTQTGQFENGFVFYRVISIGDIIFLSFSDGRKSELWILDKDGGKLQKLPFSLNIVSFAPGP